MTSLSLGWCPSETTKLSSNSLQSLLSDAQNNNFTFVNVPIQVSKINSSVELKDLNSLKSWQKTLIASSDRSLFDSNDWSNRILFRISTIDPNLELLLDYAAHLTVFAVLIEDDWTVENVLGLMKLNEAKAFPFKFYFKCPFGDWIKWRSLTEFLESTGNEKYLLNLAVVPELTDTVSFGFSSKIWHCEHLKGLIIDEQVFLKNAKGYPVLPRAIQDYLIGMKKILEYPIILKTSASVAGDCATYIKWLLNPDRPENLLVDEGEKRMKMFVEGFENVLQTPLQPLHDHLPSETYEIFERDPIKYQKYEEAIEAALRDMPVSIKENRIKIGVFGAGRGPLVEAALNAADKVGNCRVNLVALEKSPNACLTLLDRFKSHPNVQIVYGDMRDNNSLENGTFDIIVSELLGSFGDNELSPECLWPVEGLLKADKGIFIPQEYTSYIEPCYAPLLREQVKELEGTLAGDPFDYNYVVHVTRAYTKSTLQPVFKFEHPKRSDTCDAVTLKLEDFDPIVPIDGLIGYFDCKLYGSVYMSTVPGNTSSPGMLSWFPIYFPLKQNARNGADVTFKRCKDERRVWYEWSIEGDETASIIVHNPQGRSHSINLQ